MISKSTQKNLRMIVKNHIFVKTIGNALFKIRQKYNILTIANFTKPKNKQ